MIMHWLFQNFFAMMVVGLVVVVALVVILQAVIRHLLHRLAHSDYAEFLREPTNYAVQERPTEYHGGGALSRAAVKRHAERWAKSGSEWGFAMVALLVLMTGVMIFAIHTASQNSNPLEVITSYLSYLGALFLLSLACMVLQKICFTMAGWYGEAAKSGTLPPPPGVPAAVPIRVIDDAYSLLLPIDSLPLFHAYLDGRRFPWLRHQLRRLFSRSRGRALVCLTFLCLFASLSGCVKDYQEVEEEAALAQEEHDGVSEITSACRHRISEYWSHRTYFDSSIGGNRFTGVCRSNYLDGSGNFNLFDLQTGKETTCRKDEDPRWCECWVRDLCPLLPPPPR